MLHNYAFIEILERFPNDFMFHFLQSEMNFYSNDNVEPTEDVLKAKELNIWHSYQRQAIIFMAFINVGVVIALGILTIWHAKLIYCGETSIEAHINASETKRLSSQGKLYQNPYDFGPVKNFQLFLGLSDGR